MKNIVLKMSLLIGLCAVFSGIKGMQDDQIIYSALDSNDPGQVENALKQREKDIVGVVEYNTINAICPGVVVQMINNNAGFDIGNNNASNSSQPGKKPGLISRMASSMWNHKKVTLLIITGLLGLGTFCYWKYKK